MMDIPVNRRSYSNDRQLAVRRSDGLEKSGFGFDTLDEMDRQFENMERQLTSFQVIQAHYRLKIKLHRKTMINQLTSVLENI